MSRQYDYRHGYGYTNGIMDPGIAVTERGI